MDKPRATPRAESRRAGKAQRSEPGEPGRGRRRVGARLFVWTVFGIAGLCVAGVAGAVVLSHTAAGREAALDWVLARVAPRVNGSVTVGSVSPGGLLGGATLHDIRIIDAEGHLVLVVDSARAGYSVGQLLSARPGVDEFEIWSLTLDLAPEDGRRVRMDSLLVSSEPAPDSATGSAAGLDEVPGGFLLRGVRIHDGTVLLRNEEGGRKEVELVEAVFGQVAIRPEAGTSALIDVENASLSYPLRGGLLALREVRGTVRVGEHTIDLDIDHFEAPASVGRGSVHVEPGDDGWPAVFDLDMERLALADLDWIDERFDRGAARGGIRITTGQPAVRVEFTDAEVELGSARMGIGGALTLRDPVQFEGISLTPARLPTSEVNRWLTEPAPIAGLLSGQLRLDGERGRLDIAGDLALVPESGRDAPVRLSGRGTVLGGGSVEDVAVSAAGFDYELLRILTPQVPWEGTGDMTLRLDGDLGTGMAVEIVANQTGAEGSESSVAVGGTIYGDTSISVVDLQVRMEPLSLTTLGEFYPAFPLSGEVGGVLSVSGSLDRLQFTSDLQTVAGRLTAQGQFNARDPASGYQLAASVEDFHLSRLLDGLPDPVVLTASATLNGRGLDIESVRSALALDAASLTVGRLQLDSAAVQAWVDDDGLLQVASVYAESGGIVLQGGGSLGTVAEAGDGVTLSLSSPTIRPLRGLFMGEGRVAWDELLAIEQSMMIELEGVDPDTFPRAADLRFNGRVDARAQVTGALASLATTGSVAFDNLEYGRTSARSLRADFTLSPPRDPIVIEGSITGDSVVFRDRRYQSALVEGSFALGGGGRVRALVSRSDSESYEGQGVVGLHEEGGRIDLDRLTVIRDDRRWNLRGPARFDWSPDAFVVRDFGLIRPGTEGLRVRANGRLARAEGESDFAMEVAELDLGVVGSLLQLEAPPTGVVTANLTASGTGHEPEWAGTIEVADVEYRTLSFERVAAEGDFADGVLQARMESWSEGRRNLRAAGTIPLDLRLVKVADRIPDDPLDVQVVADSFPAAMVLGGIRGLEEIEGTVSGDVRLRGRPDSLEPDGSLHLDDAEATVVAFGTRLSSTQIDLDLDPSGVMTVEGSAESGGTLDFRGTVGGDGPAGDVPLNLAFWPRQFQIVDRLDIEAAVTGDSVALSGTFNFPFIEGAVDVNDGTVFIEEFQRTAETIDFYDPALFNAASEQLGSVSGDDRTGGVGERSPFIQNLRLLVDLHMGRGNRLRSRRMTVEPAGDLELTFDRAGDRLILRGEVQVVRGDFRLGPSTLNVTDGVFRFPGTPGFDPDIEVTAVTSARTGEGEPLEITTNISGTLLSPSTSFTSDAAYAIPEPELLSLLVLGRPTTSLLGNGGAGSVGAGGSLLMNQLYSEIGYLVAEEFDFDYVSVSQTEQGLATTALGATSLEVEVGWYVLDDVFLTGVYQRGVCADPTVPVSSGGVRVEVELPRDVTLEGFLEGRCTRDRYRGLGDISLELAHIWGFLFFREWGY